MEFSYRLSEAEYLQAWRLGRKASSKPVVKTIMFWVFILACLMLFFVVMEKQNQPVSAPDDSSASQTSTEQAPSHAPAMKSLLVNVAPFLVLAGVWIFVVFRLVPMRVARIYRKDPYMQGGFTVSITPESISIRNTAGTSSHSGWNVYDGWREGKGLVVLRLHSGAYVPLSAVNLSEAQRTELRGILSAALPQKTGSAKSSMGGQI